MGRRVTQVCPNCQRVHDISVYVTGQRLLCSCGIHFEVQRHDVQPSIIGRNASVMADSSRNISPEDVQDPTLTPASRARAEGEEDAAAQSSKPPEIPGYVLTELIGRGGMGEVWKAQQLSLHRAVAVKLLPSRLAKDPEFVARFEKEATALAALSHPNITQIIDRGVSGDHYYFVMELVPGKSLRDVLNQGRPAPLDALRIAVQICHAIEHAHHHQIIHRDLKPENILIDESGHVKVVDFGLAGMRGSQRNVQLTATAVAMGTVNYMAPEQRKDAKNVDHRADIYSLGVMIYELLTGELPLGRFRLPSERVRGLDKRLDEIVAGALEQELDARTAQASHITKAIEPLMSQVGHAPLELLPNNKGTTVSGRGTLSSQPPSYLSGRRLPFWVLPVAVLLGMGLLYSASKFWPKDSEEAGEAPAPLGYQDTEDELFSTFDQEKGTLTLDFGLGAEELNAHAGVWKLEQQKLIATQYGPPTQPDHPKLVPRTYLAHRYYSSDDFTAEVGMDLKPLPEEFPQLPSRSQRYGELAFRIKDVQVSVFALVDEGVRLNWRYLSNDGSEQVGTSESDVESLTADESRVPSGHFRLKLQLSKVKGGNVRADVYINGEVIIRKALPALSGMVGKVAMGCRNMVCEFDELKVSGKAVDRPKTLGAEAP